MRKKSRNNKKSEIPRKKECGCDRTVMCFLAKEDHVGSTPTIRSKIEYAGLMFNSSMTGFHPVRMGAIPITRSKV